MFMSNRLITLSFPTPVLYATLIFHLHSIDLFFADFFLLDLITLTNKQLNYEAVCYIKFSSCYFGLNIKLNVLS